MKKKVHMTPRTLQIIGLIIAIPLLIYAVVNNLWAEPEPPKSDLAFSVHINHTANTENEQTLEVETLYGDEMYYLAQCIEAEAGNQSILGRRLVADVVLNRVDSPDFPDSITEVINESNQFAVVSNRMIDTVHPSEGTWKALYIELNYRINEDIMYFNTGGYPDYGTPYERVGDHYFSTF